MYSVAGTGVFHAQFLFNEELLTLASQNPTGQAACAQARRFSKVLMPDLCKRLVLDGIA